ncbi:MAG: hypothetical protein CM15mP71_5540 [Candidatus Poseidoniales archaeon]|nr:MAG: hypothetical protein CM15mP71_5540 [Candidatus Poseidoniales archaeon]
MIHQEAEDWASSMHGPRRGLEDKYRNRQGTWYNEEWGLRYKIDN